MRFPREAFATLVVDGGERDAVVAAIEAELARVRDEYRPADPNIQLAVKEDEEEEDRDAHTTTWDADTTATVLRLVTSLPHGVEAMSYAIPDLVETSTNLATVKADNGSLVITTSSRSSIDAALEALRRRIRATGLLAGATIHESPAYPGWKPNLDSHLLSVVKTVHQQELGSTPEVKAIHAGLECGIIGQKIAGMDMISFGPVIEFPHSPDERVQIESVGRFYRLLGATLAALA